MLLPSLIDCDVSRKPSKHPARALLTSFSLSSTTSASGQTLTNVYSTCHALQMILRSSDALNDSNSCQLPPSKSRSSLTSSKIRLHASSRIYDYCTRNSFKKTRSKNTKISIPGQNLTKRMSMTNDKDINSPNVGSQSGETNIKKSNSHTEKLQKQKPISSPPQKSRSGNNCVSRELEPLNVFRSEIQKSCTPEILTLSIPSPLKLDEKIINDISSEEDQFLAKLVYRKLQMNKREWYDFTLNLNPKRANIGSQWNFLSTQVKSVLKKMKDKT